MKTYIPTDKDFARKTYLIDASGKTLGRLATRIASLLIGKGKTSFCKDQIAGDQVIVVHADKVLVSGKKKEQKIYKHYSGYPGGLKTYTFEELMEKKPVEVLERAVQRMLPKNRLGDKMMTHLRVYAGANHQQQAQKPIPYEVA